MPESQIVAKRPSISTSQPPIQGASDCWCLPSTPEWPVGGPPCCCEAPPSMLSTNPAHRPHQAPNRRLSCNYYGHSSWFLLTCTPVIVTVAHNETCLQMVTKLYRLLGAWDQGMVATRACRTESLSPPICLAEASCVIISSGGCRGGGTFAVRKIPQNSAKFAKFAFSEI